MSFPFFTVLGLVVMASTVIISLYLTQLLINFLNSKPLGLQNIMDEMNKLLFRCYQSVVLMAGIINAMVALEIQVGPFVAAILATIQLVVGFLLPKSLMVNAGCQHIIFHHFQRYADFPLSDTVIVNAVVGMLLSVTWVEVACILSISDGLAVHYVKLSGRDGESSIIPAIYISVQWVLTAVVVIVIRKLISRTPINGAMFSKHMIKMRVLLFQAIVFGGIAVVYIPLRNVIDKEVFVCLIYPALVVFPMMCIFDCPESREGLNCRQFALRRIKELPVISHALVLVNWIAKCFHDCRGSNSVVPYDCPA